MNLINILYVTSTLQRTGPNNVLYNLVTKLDRKRFVPTILTLSNVEPGAPDLTSDFIGDGIAVFNLSLTRTKALFVARKQIKKIVERLNITIIHNFGFRPDYLITKSLFFDKKIVSTINSNIYDDYTMLYGHFKGSLMAKIHISKLKNKKAIACSSFVSEQLFLRYGVKLDVVYNGIPKERYVPIGEAEKIVAKKEIGIEAKNLFIFVGYLISRKDPLTVLKSFVSANFGRDFHLLMLGDGPLMGECRKIAGLNKNISFLGNTSETLKYLLASDYYISSSHSEGIPTSVMEAMACGVPIILSNIQPHKELCAPMETWNYFFNVGDEKMLRDKLLTIPLDKREKLGKCCRYVIENYINSDIMAKNYQEIYLENE